MLVIRLPLPCPSPALLFLDCSCRFNRSALVITFTACFKKSSGCAEISETQKSLVLLALYLIAFWPFIRAAEVPWEYQNLQFRTGFLQLPKGFLYFPLLPALTRGTITPAYMSSAPNSSPDCSRPVCPIENYLVSVITPLHRTQQWILSIFSMLCNTPILLVTALLSETHHTGGHTGTPNPTSLFHMLSEFRHRQLGWDYSHHFFTRWEHNSLFHYSIPLVISHGLPILTTSSPLIHS